MLSEKNRGRDENVVLVLDESDAVESLTVDVEPEALAHAVRHALGATLADIVATETRSAINTMRGRID